MAGFEKGRADCWLCCVSREPSEDNAGLLLRCNRAVSGATFCMLPLKNEDNNNIFQNCLTNSFETTTFS